MSEVVKEPIENKSDKYLDQVYRYYFNSRGSHFKIQEFEVELIAYCLLYKPSDKDFLIKLNKLLLVITDQLFGFNKWVYLNELNKKIELKLNVEGPFDDPFNVIYNYKVLEPWKKVIETLI